MKIKNVKKSIVVTMALTLVIPLLAACNSGNDAKDTEKRVLRIATMNSYGGDDQYLRQQFTEIYEFAHPNIEIEIVAAIEQNNYNYEEPKAGEKQPDPVEKMKELLTGPNPPDVVMTDFNVLPQLVEQNLLTQLDPMITEDKFDTTDIVPAVIEGLKKLGDGKLYALAPTFSSSALYYNKVIFEQAGVPFPTDKMTWDDIFNLARRVTSGDGDKRKYGFSFSTYQGSDPFWDMNLYTQPLQLSMFDDKGEKMTVDTDAWENVWKTISGLNTEKILPQPMDPNQVRPQGKVKYNPFEQELFLSGNVAMTLSDYGYVNRIIDANKNAQKVEGFVPVDWDVVTLPIHPSAPDVGGNIWMNGVMGINAKAQNVDDAWDYIKFINGEDWARLKSRSMYEMVSRKKYIQPKEGLTYNIGAFYQLTPAPQPTNTNLYQTMPNIYQVQEIGRTKFQEVLKGTKKVRDALKEWNTEGNAMLQDMKKNPNGTGTVGGIEPRPMDTVSEAVYD